MFKHKYIIHAYIIIKMPESYITYAIYWDWKNSVFANLTDAYIFSPTDCILDFSFQDFPNIAIRAHFNYSQHLASYCFLCQTGISEAPCAYFRFNCIPITRIEFLWLWIKNVDEMITEIE